MAPEHRGADRNTGGPGQERGASHAVDVAEAAGVPSGSAKYRTPRSARPGLAPSPGAVAAPWVRSRLRAAPGTTFAMGFLVLVTAFLAAALPRSVDSFEDRALHRALARTDLDERSIAVTADITGRAGSVPSPAQLAAGAQAFLKTARPPVVVDRQEIVYGVRNAVPTSAVDRGLPRPSQVDPIATLITQQHDLASHTELISGRLPSSRGDGTAEAAVTADTAKVMHLRVGSSVHVKDAAGSPVTVRITGIVKPRHPHAGFWNAEPDLRRPSLWRLPQRDEPKYYWHFTLLIDSDARGVLLGFRGGATAFWHHPLRTESLTARDVPALQRALTSLSNGADADRLERLSHMPWLTVDHERLSAVIAEFTQERRAAAPLVQIAAVGVGTVAAVVLLMAGGLVATGRRAELGLLRARGAGLPGLGRLLLGESAAIAVPAAAMGTLLALLLVPAGRSAAALLLGAAVAALASLVLPLRAVIAHRRPRPAGREDIATARPSRRRTVAELTVVVIAVGALVALRRRGSSAGTDLLTAAAPVLLAVAAALVLLRLYPVLLRLLARATARLPGAVAHLGLARAGRAGAGAALPLLAVLTALTIASFGGSVLAGVASARAHAALAAVSADARVEAIAPLPDGLADRVRRVEGVQDVTAVRAESGLSITRGSFLSTTFTLLCVDPASYARLAARTGADGGGPFPAAALSRANGRTPLPAVVSPGLADAIGRGRITTVIPDSGPTRIRAVAVRTATPAATGEFAIVSAAALARAHPDYRGSPYLKPTALYITGPHLNDEALLAVARRAASDATVTVRSREQARYRANPLQSGTQRIYLTAVAAGTGYSVLALLLSLLQTAPQRRVVLTRLRAMGMARPQSQALVLVETLPQTLLGAVGGVLTGLAAVLLLRPGVDLTALTFTATASQPAAEAVLEPDMAALLLPSAGLLVVACVVLGAQTWLSSRRNAVEDLRMSEHT